MAANRSPEFNEPLPAPLPPQQTSYTQSKVSYPFNNDLIARALDGLNLQYGLNSNGDPMSRFSSDKFGGDLTVWFLVVGDNKDIFRVIETVNVKIPKNQWNAALVTCNAYHQSSWFGRAFLLFTEGQTEPTLYYDSQIQLQDGTTIDCLKQFIKTNVDGAQRLFEMAHSEYKLY
jgi:hypothetical protein